MEKATESERRQATILFADISGFTSMSERLDAEEMTAIVDDCFAILGSAVSDQGGVIDKFMGDCVMALFGAPKALEGAPQKAIKAALRMVSDMQAFNQRRKLAIPLGIHIGINSGEVLSGHVGTAERRDYTVMGDTVNVASRLKDLAETGEILVGPFTWRSTRDAFRFVPKKPTAVKGKAEPVQVYSVEGLSDNADTANTERMIQSVLVGRDEELRKLEFQVMKLANGEGSVINLIGEAGIGKSRLCAELYAKDFMKWVTVLEGRALAVGQNLSWYPIIGIVKSWASISEEDGEESALAKLETMIRSILPERSEETIAFVAKLMGYRLPGQYAKHVEEILDESLGKIIALHFKDLILKAAALKPILFILEDLHWADDSTFDLLHSLTMLCATHPVGFLCAWRPGYESTTGKFHRFLGENLPGKMVDIGLAALAAGQAEELARNLLRSAGIPKKVMERIVEKADGNPFFIEEVIRSFIDTGLMRAGKDELILSGDVASIEIPNGIDEVIMSRVDRLDDGMKELLRVASVIGRSFFYRILEKVADSGRPFGQCIEDLKALQLIRERTSIGEVEYLFKHVLVQETIYNSILIRSRKLLHLKVARAIEEAFPERLPEFYGILAFHYSQGEDLDKAEEYLEKAGKAALESAASSEALQLLQKALAIYMQKKGREASSAKLAAFEKTIARAFMSRGLSLQTLAHYDKALEYLGEGRKSPLGKAVAAANGFLSLLGYLYLPFTRSDKDATGAEADILSLMMNRCMVLAYVNSTDLVLDGFGLVRRVLAWNLQSIPSSAQLLCMISQFLAITGFPFTLVDRTLCAIEPLLKNDLDRCYFGETVIHQSLFSGMRLHQNTDQEVDLLLRLGDVTRAINMLQLLGSRSAALGSFGDAERITKKTLEVAKIYDNDGARNNYHFNAILINHVKRTASATLEHENAILALNEKRGDSASLGFCLAVKAYSLILLGDTQSAAELIDQAMRSFRQEKFILPVMIMPPLISALFLRIRTYGLAKTKAERKEIVRLARPVLRQIRKHGPKLMMRYPEALRLEGTFYFLMGKSRAALKHLGKGLEIAERLGTKPELGRLSFEAAKVLAHRKGGNATLARHGTEHYAKRARELFTELELEVDLKELDEWEKGQVAAARRTMGRG